MLLIIINKTFYNVQLTEKGVTKARAATPYMKENSFRCECLKSLSDRSLLLIDAGRAFQVAGSNVPNDRWWPNKEYDRGMRSLYASAERRISSD